MMAKAQDRLRRRILAVDDDPDVLRTVVWALEAAGYEVIARASADEARVWMEREGLPHLAVLDIVMPGANGLEFAAEITQFSDLPIVLLTSVADGETAAHSLTTVAEDYVRKPFRPDELAARIGRVLRRVQDFSYAEHRRVVLGPGLEVDFVRQCAWVGGAELRLTPIETKLLFVLSVNAPRTVPTAQLLERVWPAGDTFEDTLRVHVHRLRHKIEVDPSQPGLLQTVRGLGYRLGAGS